MLQGLNRKSIIVLDDTALTAGASQTARIDTLGFQEVTLDIKLGTAGGVTGQPTVLKVGESDDTNASNFTDITALVGGTATSSTVGWVIPAADTSNPQIIKFDISKVKGPRKRYLLVSLTAAVAQHIDVRGTLGRAPQLPITAATLGAAAFVAV